MIQLLIGSLYFAPPLRTDTTDDNKAELLAQLEKYRSKIEAGKVELAAINRKVATLKRQIEQVPNRMELREYRLRFSELYNQGMAKRLNHFHNCTECSIDIFNVNCSFLFQYQQLIGQPNNFLACTTHWRTQSVTWRRNYLC